MFFQIVLINDQPDAFFQVFGLTMFTLKDVLLNIRHRFRNIRLSSPRPSRCLSNSVVKIYKFSKFFTAFHQKASNPNFSFKAKVTLLERRTFLCFLWFHKIFSISMPRWNMFLRHPLINRDNRLRDYFAIFSTPNQI